MHMAASPQIFAVKKIIDIIPSFKVQESNKIWMLKMAPEPIVDLVAVCIKWHNALSLEPGVWGQCNSNADTEFVFKQMINMWMVPHERRKVNTKGDWLEFLHTPLSLKRENA